MAYIRCYALSIGIATKTYVSEQIVAFGYIPKIYTTLPIAYFRPEGRERAKMAI